MNKLPFAVLAITFVFALTTCKNPWINELLKSPSELSSLEVVAYAGETKLQGGAAFEPPFSAAVRDYLVYVPLETSRFTVNAGYDGNGTITWTTAGMDGAVSSNSFTFNFYDSEDTRVLTMVVERENMDLGEYHLAVTRTDNIPPPKGIEVTVTPPVATYFLGGGVVPVIEVTVEPPTDGGVLSYQWFRNDDDNNVTGTLLYGQTGTSYTLEGSEIEVATTTYYYVEVTKILEGRTAKLASKTRSVTFLDRAAVLDVKSGKISEEGHYLVKVPAGTVTEEVIRAGGEQNPGQYETWVVVDEDGYWIPTGGYAKEVTPWTTNGFLMGRFPVTYELWELVRLYAEKENYKFANAGNQGADDNTDMLPEPVGNKLHPVTMINWRDAIVWCNAYSEMSGFDPVYRDSANNVLTDSRRTVELLIDDSKTKGKNGYRLPTFGEQEYAGHGGVPSTTTPWTYSYPGGDDKSLYVWDGVPTATGEVGSRLPNSIGLYDMMGNIYELLYSSPENFAHPRVNYVAFIWAANYMWQYSESLFGGMALDVKRITGLVSSANGLRIIRYEVE